MRSILICQELVEKRTKESEKDCAWSMMDYNIKQMYTSFQQTPYKKFLMKCIRNFQLTHIAKIHILSGILHRMEIFWNHDKHQRKKRIRSSLQSKTGLKMKSCLAKILKLFQAGRSSQFCIFLLHIPMERESDVWERSMLWQGEVGPVGGVN